MSYQYIAPNPLKAIKYVNHDIVFQEFPDEVTLAINLSRCPNGCPGCHSKYLTSDVGDVLTPKRLASLIDEYAGEITCVGLMGGDNNPKEVAQLLKGVKHAYPHLKTGWYSGRQDFPEDFQNDVFDYVKVGPYVEDFGPLNSSTTNQRFYRIEKGKMKDMTYRFQKRH